ncbi:MAG: hypothetical protein U0900_21385 [Myxococcota bacterium]
MSLLEAFELASYVVTVVGLPFAILVFAAEQRKERENEEEESFQLLSNAYTDFLRLVLDHPDLRLRSEVATPDLSSEQHERMLVLFDILISLFERAYILLYEDPMPAHRERQWHSWDDYMREWCRREDFRRLLPELVRGEDPEFAAYIARIAREEAPRLPGAAR